MVEWTEAVLVGGSACGEGLRFPLDTNGLPPASYATASQNHGPEIWVRSHHTLDEPWFYYYSKKLVEHRRQFKYRGRT